MHAAGPKNPLHGVTLETMVTRLQAHYGWEMLGRMIKINCFTWQPSIKSSLTFLRKTPWARTKVEELYLDSLPDMEADEAKAAAPSPGAEAVDPDTGGPEGTRSGQEDRLKPALQRGRANRLDAANEDGAAPQEREES